jgi:hypothetical protein
MDPVILEIIRTGLISLFVAVVASYVTFNLSFSQFRKEKKWEKKFEAYSNILNAMFGMIRYEDKLMDEEIGDAKLGADFKKNLAELAKEGRTEVERAATIGGFLISKDSATQINKMLKELDATMADFDKMSFYSFLDNRVSITKKYIDSINKLADEDLQNNCWNHIFFFMRKKK